MSNQVRAKLLRQLAALDEKRMNDPVICLSGHGLNEAASRIAAKDAKAKALNGATGGIEGGAPVRHVVPPKAD